MIPFNLSFIHATYSRKKKQQIISVLWIVFNEFLKDEEKKNMI